MEVEFGCVGIPLSVEVIVVRVLALSLIPLVRGDCCLASAHPSKYRGDCYCALPLV